MNARKACELLVAAYSQDEGTGSSIDWADLDLAHEAAVTALAEPDPLRTIAEIAVNPQGTMLEVLAVLAKAGIVQEVYSLGTGPKPKGEA